jgi:hypothetical protein
LNFNGLPGLVPEDRIFITIAVRTSNSIIWKNGKKLRDMPTQLYNIAAKVSLCFGSDTWDIMKRERKKYKLHM